MKSSQLTLFFFLLALTVSFSQGDEQVTDAGGSPIFPGKSYTIRPKFSRPIRGGGVLLGRTGNYTCPATILQEYSNARAGLPVKITIPGISLMIIFTNMPVYFSFEERPNGECADLNSTRWAIIREDKNDDFVPGTRWIGIDGAGGPNKTLYPGMFRIERFDDESYKLVFCSKVDKKYKYDPDQKYACNDVVTLDHGENAGRRLVLNDTLLSYSPYPIVFVEHRETL